MRGELLLLIRWRKELIYNFINAPAQSGLETFT